MTEPETKKKCSRNISSWTLLYIIVGKLSQDKLIRHIIKKYNDFRQHNYFFGHKILVKDKYYLILT